MSYFTIIIRTKSSLRAKNLQKNEYLIIFKIFTRCSQFGKKKFCQKPKTFLAKSFLQFKLLRCYVLAPTPSPDYTTLFFVLPPFAFLHVSRSPESKKLIKNVIQSHSGVKSKICEQKCLSNSFRCIRQYVVIFFKILTCVFNLQHSARIAQLYCL